MMEAGDTMFKNYMFDLYGTLIDINTNEWDRKLWEKISVLYRYRQADYTAEEIQNGYGKYVQEEKDLVHRRFPEYSEIDIKIEKVFKRLFTAKNVKCTKRDVQEICTAFRCYSTVYIRLYDGVLDLLDTLKAKGKRIYLLSNAQRSFTENELNMFGLMPYFDGVVISSDEECCKPDVHYYNTLIDRYNLKKSETIMIGNDYLSDIRGAKNAGIKSLYIHQSISPEIEGELEADFRVMDGDVYKIKELVVRK